MTRRPMLILNGKPRRYWRLRVTLCAIGFEFNGYMPQAVIDWIYHDNVQVSVSTRRSGRRMIYVDVPEVE